VDARRQLANVIDASHYIALRAALAGASRDGSTTADTLDDLSDKLETALNSKERERLAALRDCFLDAGARASLQQVGPDVLWPVMTAIAERRYCRFDYSSPSHGDSTFAALPLRLFVRNGATYALVARRGQDKVITIALHRVRELKVTDDKGIAPTGFNPQRYVSSLFGVHGEGREVRYRLAFDADVAVYIRERQWHPTQRLRSRRDGGVLLDFTCQESFEVEAWIASWRDHVTVLEPEAVRQNLRALGEALVARYR
jgi:predicted DNA-binding transcriptional regulator YafY